MVTEECLLATVYRVVINELEMEFVEGKTDIDEEMRKVPKGALKMGAIIGPRVWDKWKLHSYGQ